MGKAETKNSERILITGASGLLGISLVYLAREQARQVAGIYRNHPVAIDGAELLAANLEDHSEILRIFSKFAPSSVVHCAAATDVEWCEEHPDEAYRLNVDVSSTIAEITCRSKARLLYVSTDSVFDGEHGNYAEEDTPAPVNVYARTKLAGERAVLSRNPKATIARVNLYGWNAQPKFSLAEWVLQQLSDGKVVPGFSDVFFCPILANDLAEALLALLDLNQPGIYHVVGSETVSKYEFAKRLAVVFGFDAQQVQAGSLADSRLKAPRPRNMSLNTAKISAAIGRSMPGVDAGLRRFAQLRESGYVDCIKSPVAGAR